MGCMPNVNRKMRLKRASWLPTNMYSVKPVCATPAACALARSHACASYAPRSEPSDGVDKENTDSPAGPRRKPAGSSEAAEATVTPEAADDERPDEPLATTAEDDDDDIPGGQAHAGEAGVGVERGEGESCAHRTKAAHTTRCASREPRRRRR